MSLIETQSTRSLTEYEIHDVLRNERRVWVLKYLQQKSEPVPLRELSEELAAFETGETPPPRNIRESVYNALHQTHLPKLNNMGIVEYNRDRKLIALADGSQQVNLYMEVITNDGITWGSYYLVMGLLALVVIAFSSVGAPVFAMFSVPVCTGVFTALFIISALCQVLMSDGIYIGLS